AILIAIGFVALSRAVDFRPGLLYGFIGAYTILSADIKPSNRQHGMTILLSSGIVAAIALIAFFLRGLIYVPGTTTANFWLYLIEMGLVCIFAICLEGVLFNLVPMTFLPGSKILAWKKWVWAVLTTLVAFAFWWIIINEEGTLAEAAILMDVKVMLGLMAFMLILSIATWLYFRIRYGQKPAESIGYMETQLPSKPGGEEQVSAAQAQHVDDELSDLEEPEESEKVTEENKEEPESSSEKPQDTEDNTNFSQ
ncbi:hypothetical protein ACFLTL_02140, partial [Chloroflexota bacterium]